MVGKDAVPHMYNDVVSHASEEGVLHTSKEGRGFDFLYSLKTLLARS